MMDGGRFFNSMLILSGSPGQNASFVERLTDKNADADKTIIYNTPQWEVLKDKIKYSGKTFKVFTGDESNEPKVITHDKELEYYSALTIDDPSKLIDVPIEYEKEFNDDLLIAIRDLSGRSSRSSLAYFTNVEKLTKSLVLPNKFFNIDSIKLPFFDNTQIKDYLINPDESITSRLLNPTKPRYIHIDLGIVSDLTGLAMSHISEFITNRTIDPITKKYVETFDPWFINDFHIGISRESGSETNISKIRDFIIHLKESGVNIARVTLDGYQSTQLKQELITNGITCEIMSVTRTSVAFDTFKRTVYEGRLLAPLNKLAKDELLQFKKELRSGNKVKIVHPGSNHSGTSSHGDIAEALVGSIHSANLNKDSQLDPLRNFNPDNFTRMINSRLADDVTNPTSQLVDSNGFTEASDLDLLLA
jgi:hypothetical protein